MFAIAKDFHFSASHMLRGLKAGHKCGNMHGHNYTVSLYLKCDDLDETGFVLDYGDLSPFRQWLDDVFDHAHICMDYEELAAVASVKSVVHGFEPVSWKDVDAQRGVIIGCQSSAENIARFIYCVWSDLLPISAVKVKETDKTMAVYDGPGLDLDTDTQAFQEAIVLQLKLIKKAGYLK